MKYARSYLTIALIAFGLAFAPQSKAIPVDLELSLVIDVSPSVNNTEFDLQMSGYEAAFQDAAVQAAIAGLPGGIAVNVIFFSQNAVQKQGWTHITGAATANAFAGLFTGFSRTPPVNSGTDIAEGYNLAIGSFGGNGFEGLRETIDISGDGPQNQNGGCPPLGNGTNPACTAQTDAARAAAEAAGIVVNGLVIGPNDPLFAPNTGVEYYEMYIITSSGFATAATNFNEFAPVVRDKILREIIETPAPGALGLLAAGLAGVGFSRRWHRQA